MRIAIVNDMRIACEALKRAVTAEGRHEVAWIATDGAQATHRARGDRPDLILMDMIMPGVDGVEATRRIMHEAPCPILVVTSTVSGNINKVYEAMGHGALDAVETPQFGPGGELTGAAPLLEKIERLTRLCEPHSLSRVGAGISADSSRSGESPRLVLLGASTGGPKVIGEILSTLPADLPAAVLIAQHVDEAYAGGLASWLSTQHSKLPVEVAREGTLPQAGQVYLALSDRHLVIGPNRTLRYAVEPVGWYRPSVDALFHSAAKHWPTKGVAALLTGMGRDGAEGTASLRRAGWITVAQDQASSVVWGMPKAAVELGAAQRVLPPHEIVRAIIAAVTGAAPLATSASRPK